MANNTNKFLDKAGLTRLISWIKSALNSKQNVISSSNKISADYVELDYGDTVQDGIDTLFSSKQDKLTGTSSLFVKGDGSFENDSNYVKYAESSYINVETIGFKTKNRTFGGSGWYRVYQGYYSPVHLMLTRGYNSPAPEGYDLDIETYDITLTDDLWGIATITQNAGYYNSASNQEIQKIRVYGYNGAPSSNPNNTDKSKLCIDVYINDTSERYNNAYDVSGYCLQRNNVSGRFFNYAELTADNLEYVEFCQGKNNARYYSEFTLVDGFKTNKKAVAQSFVKEGATADQFLLGDGSVTTLKTVNDTSLLGSGNIAVQSTLVSGTNIKTINNTSLLGSGNISVQAPLTFDTTPTTNSDNPVTSGGVKAAIDALGTPNEIASITTQESSASGGNNVVTITDTDGTVTTFNVKNGIDGQDGADGVSLGEIALVQTTGDSEESVMSQKTVTNELTAAQVVKPSYFTGLMLTYLLEDYPMFDIRKCDGVSIVMDAIQYNLGRSSSNFVISKGVSINTDSAFCIFQSWGNLKVGLYKQYGGTAVQGMTVGNGNNAYFSHRVYTVDFLTGVCKVYKNGVLVNTLTPSSYDYSVLKDFFDNTATRLSIGPGTRDAQLKTSSMAVFGHVLTDDDVTDLYGNGSDSVCGNLIPDKWKANWLIPHTITNWGTEHYNATKTTHANGGAVFTTNSTSGALLRFGFTGIPITGESAVRGNIIYEWDFEVLSGSANANYSMQNGSYAYKSWKIIDSEGNELEDGTLVEVGNTYHVINKPDNLANGYYDSTGTSLHLGYVFNNPSSDFSIWVKPELKLTERGAAIVCGPDEYKDVYWEMPNGTHIPNNKTLNLWNILGHNTLPITQGVHYGGFKDKTVIYSSSKLPQFNGQIAVDSNNGKIYIGYLTSTGGIWKLTGSGSGSGGGIDEEVDPIFSASPAANITASDISKWDTGEANVQSDWNITDSTSDAFIKNKPSIPSNTLSTSYDKASNPAWPAANDTYENAISKLHKVVSDNDLTVAGALNDLENRKANSEDLASVATSGNYNDLSNKPSAVTESTVSGWGFTKNAGTITGITMNGSSKGTSGVVNLGTVLTEHQSLTNYYTKSDIDNAGYLTSESDPTVPAHVKAITQQNITDWNNKLSSFTETDPTVPAWAKATSKPTYTASEVGAVPNTRKVNGKVLSSDISLTASDVGALPNTTVIPAAQVLSDWNATSGMGVILNKPTIPTVNNATLTILKNGTTVNTFTANASSNVTANILVNELPTVSSTDNNKILMVVNGAWTLVSPTTVYTGTSTPSSSQGINGDLYILTS